MLLETMRIAATAWQREMVGEPGAADAPDSIRIRFPHTGATQPGDPLLSFLTLRSVDRRAYRRRRLSAPEMRALDACVTAGMTIDWYEDARDCWRIARLSAMATSIRLRCPETFTIHQRMIDWDRALSPFGIPARAAGVSGPTVGLMRWAMRRWARTKWLNRLGGTLIASVQMDLLPGLYSGAYFVLRRSAASAGNTDSPADLMQMGRAIQRFWLTATRLGLAMQPTVATVAFADYGERKIKFSSEPGLSGQSEMLAQAFRDTLGVAAEEVVFMGRIGEPNRSLPTHRSTRRPLVDLIR
jgi:nitroreductase